MSHYGLTAALPAVSCLYDYGITHYLLLQALAA